MKFLSSRFGPSRSPQKAKRSVERAHSCERGDGSSLPMLFVKIN